jgi:hypothetical protein
MIWQGVKFNNDIAMFAGHFLLVQRYIKKAGLL